MPSLGTVLRTAIGALVTVTVLGIAGYAATHRVPVADAGQTPGYNPSASDSAAAAASSSSQSSTSHSGPLIAAYLGDDYTAGAGASSTATRFSSVLSTALGLTERNFGVPDTGYAKAAAGGGDYASRVAAVVAAHPDVVIVSGGRNDLLDTNAGDDAAARAGDLFTALHAQLPSTVLIAVAPWWGDGQPRPGLESIAAGIQAAVVSAGGHYLAIPDPLRGHPEYMADAADPNDNGYAAIAAALQPLLAAQLPPRS